LKEIVVAAQIAKLIAMNFSNEMTWKHTHLNLKQTEMN
jgi:hypothetical protein